MIRELNSSDKEWCVRLFSKYTKQLGNLSGGTWFWRMEQANINTGTEKLIGVERLAFAHYRARRDGVNVLYEIAVHPIAQGQGIGKALVEYIGRPMNVKTDYNNTVAKCMYQRLGFTITDYSVAKSGKEMVAYSWR